MRFALSISAALLLATFYNEGAWKSFAVQRDKPKETTHSNPEPAPTNPSAAFTVWKTNAHSGDETTSLFSSDSNCHLLGQSAKIETPPRRLATLSKYGQRQNADGSTDETAKATRAAIVKPIYASLRKLDELSHKDQGRCLFKTAKLWAGSGALLEMATKDAMLTRSRMIAELGMLLLAYQRTNSDTIAQDTEIQSWLAQIAEQTIRFFDSRPNATSSRNNHRYWAALAVMTTGKLLAKPEFENWGATSLEIGLCQINDKGFLPLELARASKAHAYHAYAFRPLAATALLSASTKDSKTLRCRDRLKRLSALLLSATADRTLFDDATGFPQNDPASEASFVSALNMDFLRAGLLEAKLLPAN